MTLYYLAAALFVALSAADLLLSLKLQRLGAVVPQVVEVIGRAILAAESASSRDTNAVTAPCGESGVESGAGGGTRTPDPRTSNAE